MQKELNIPTDDIDCWAKYPKHQWVYNLSYLLDAQNIKWSPFESSSACKTSSFNFYTSKDISIAESYIYTEIFSKSRYIAEAYILRGEIKLIRYFNKNGSELLETQTGNLDLRVNAFASMHFKKYSGVISLEFADNIIISVKLRSQSELGITANDTTIKLNKRIYKNS